MTEAIQNKLRFVIETTLPKKAKVAMPGVYPTWEKYLKRFCDIGGIIEAMPYCATHHIGRPTVSIYIDPTGLLKVNGAFDKFEATRFVNCGMFYPQTSVPGA
jgi:hypothetical protein